MKLSEINFLSEATVSLELQKCCGSWNWVQKMLAKRPFESENDLQMAAENCWESCTESDVLEAFSHHPKIGNTTENAQKVSSTLHWAGEEQSAVKLAEKLTLTALEKGNETYEKKFGYIFIVFATGKSAAEMLSLLEQRIPNSPGVEIEIARKEQMKITLLRLNKLLSS